MITFHTLATSPTVTASAALVPAEQVPFAITALVTVIALAGFTAFLDAKDRKENARSK